MTYLSAVVAGAGGFIGGHLVKSLIDDGYDVLAIDIDPVDEWLYIDKDAENMSLDLREPSAIKNLIYDNEEVYNLAASTGGAWYNHTNKLSCMRNASINLNLLNESIGVDGVKYFFASSASVYPIRYQFTPAVSNPRPLTEGSDFLATSVPDGNSGLEKIFNETATTQYHIDSGLHTRIGRYFNVYGPRCEWNQGLEGAVAALCRKIAIAKLSNDRFINIWGDGKQSRSFIYIDDAIDATRLLMNSTYAYPVNIGNAKSHTIDELVTVIESVAGVTVKRVYDSSGPTGVYSRACSTELLNEIIDWQPKYSLEAGIEKTYAWIYDQVSADWY
jgi:nucleoside-diphosphate-sugar epimerase